MKISLFIVLSFLIMTQAFANSATDEIWNKLEEDFNSKHYFFNADINEKRSGVKSPFMDALFGEYTFNNAVELTNNQIANLPDAYMLERKVFDLAMAGRERLITAGKIKSDSLLAIADFSKESRERRFYILDVVKGQVLINTWTSHASKSDADDDGIPELFSNVSGTGKSSAGFMVTGVTYTGMWGYSRRLIGLDPALNSNVLARAVVVHGFGGLGAQDVSYGNVATSEGCLMFSKNESGLFWGMEDKPMHELVVNALKTGTLVFTYTEVENDQAQPIIFKSTWIKQTDL